MDSEIKSKTKSLALVCSILLFTNCSRVNSSGQTLEVQIVNEPISLDPSLVQDGISLGVVNSVSEGLLGYDPAGNLENRLAESYTISSDGKHYDFTLRPNLKWSDGVPVRAEDFVTALRRTLAPTTIAQLAPVYFAIQGAQAFHAGYGVKPETLGVRAEANHLLIDLEKPAPYFLQVLTLPTALPQRKDVLNQNHGKWPESGPSTGAFRIQSHEFDQKITLEKNPFYWGKSPRINRLVFRVVTDESTALNLFEQGKLDVLSRIPALDFPRLNKQGRINSSPFFATYYISFNCKKPPFNDVRWRKAVAGAIQREEISTLLGAGEKPAWSWIPFGLEGYIPFKDPNTVFGDSVKWAKTQKLDARGVTLAFDSGTRNARVLEKIQEDIRRFLGVKLPLFSTDWKSYTKLLQSDPPPIYRYGWMSPFKDPIHQLKVFTRGDINNFSGCSNARYDHLIDEVEEMVPGKEREEKIVQAQKILLEEEVALIPLFHYVQNIGISARVKNFRINPFGTISFKDLYLE